MISTPPMKFLGVLVVAASLAGCATPTATPLYAWDSFTQQQYASLLREGASPVEQIAAMNAAADRARATNGRLPPGFRAHLGMLNLSVGNVTAARELWQAERAAFPEGAAYMDSLLKRLDDTPKSAARENPA
jgi:hypothetical protein